MNTQMSLTEGPISRYLETFALPNSCGNVPLFGLMRGVSMASSVMTAHYIGAGNTADAEPAAAASG